MANGENNLGLATSFSSRTLRARVMASRRSRRGFGGRLFRSRALPWRQLTTALCSTRASANLMHGRSPWDEQEASDRVFVALSLSAVAHNRSLRQQRASRAAPAP